MNACRDIVITRPGRTFGRIYIDISMPHVTQRLEESPRACGTFLRRCDLHTAISVMQWRANCFPTGSGSSLQIIRRPPWCHISAKMGTISSTRTRTKPAASLYAKRLGYKLWIIMYAKPVIIRFRSVFSWPDKQEHCIHACISENTRFFGYTMEIFLPSRKYLSRSMIRCCQSGG